MIFYRNVFCSIQITMLELSKQIKKKYKDFNVTPQWLGKVLRNNNKTRKRTRH